MESKVNKRDGQLPSIWEAERVSGNFLNHLEDYYDVVIVGAGLTGVSTVLKLQQLGLKCLLIDAHQIGYGTTGGTTAHLNTFLDATYPEIEKDFNKQIASLVAKASKQAIQIIQSNIQHFDIDADFTNKDGYLYAETKSQAQELEEILLASLKNGVEAEELREMPLKVPCDKVIRFSNQAQFHPLKYLHGLLEAFINMGGQICEKTKYLEHEYNAEIEKLIVHLDAGTVKVNHIIMATHIPPGITTLNFTCAPYRSYVIAAKLKEDSYPEGLFYDMQEPYHYWRTQIIDGEKFLIVGGEDHKTAQGVEPESYHNLLKYINQYYEVKEVAYTWSSQYYVPIDGLPYIGKMPFSNRNVWVATGFNGNGMIWGTVAAEVLSDLISDKGNEYAAFLNPSRIKPIAGFSEFVKENANAVWKLLSDQFISNFKDDIDKIAPNSGEVIQTEQGKLAVFKSSNGSIKAFNATCTHAGCIVKFNAFEKTWDCPCHGGRYDLDGKVITGPPIENLEPIAFKDIE